MVIRLFVLFLCCAQVCLAQFPLSTQGEVKIGDFKLEGAHVNNLNSQQSITTDSDGRFVMAVNKGDVLLVTHLSARDQYVVIFEELASNPFLSIILKEKENTLDEVVLNSSDKITVQSVGIIQGERPIPTTNERRLQTAGDFKPVHLLGLLGGSLQLDPIINAISGRTKRLKKYVAIDKEIAAYDLMMEKYAQFLRERFELTEDELKQFINYLVDLPEFQSKAHQENELQVQLWLCEQYLRLVKE